MGAETAPQVAGRTAAETIVEGGTREAASRSGVEPFLDVLFGTLSNERRRKVVRHLASERAATTLGALAEEIAVTENDVTEAELSSTQRKRVYVGLYQCHLPKMDAADVIDFDADRKTVRPGENLGVVHECLVSTERLSGPTDAPRRGVRDSVSPVLDSIRSVLRSIP